MKPFNIRWQEALGGSTTYHYAPCTDNAARKQLAAAYKKKYGADLPPNFPAVTAFDGMRVALAVLGNVPFETIPDVKDDWKELNK
jgi:ABC-type branched-subunit amino acid transport system substrate-binding protein